MVNLKIGHGATGLASPAVAAEHVVAKLVIQFADQVQAWGALVEGHSRSLLGCVINKRFFSLLGRNGEQPQDRIQHTLELPASRLAPAVKSVQIISRQYSSNLWAPAGWTTLGPV